MADAFATLEAKASSESAEEALLAIGLLDDRARAELYLAMQRYTLSRIDGIGAAAVGPTPDQLRQLVWHVLRKLGVGSGRELIILVLYGIIEVLKHRTQDKPDVPREIVAQAAELGGAPGASTVAALAAYIASADGGLSLSAAAEALGRALEVTDRD